MTDLRCTYSNLWDVLTNEAQACGKPAVVFFQWKANRRYFARCEEHRDNTDQRTAKEIFTKVPKTEKTEVTKDEFLVAKIMES